MKIETSASEAGAGARNVPLDAFVDVPEADEDDWSLSTVSNMSAALSRARKGRYRYVDTFSGYSPAQIQTICEVKRFVECYHGDRVFRAAAEAGGAFTDEQRRTLRETGVSFALEAMAPMWLHKEIVDQVHILVAQYNSLDEAPPEVQAALAPYPEMRLWLEWRHRVDKSSMIHKILSSSMENDSPEYTAWRRRRVGAVRNELGAFGWALDNPSFAVEMGVGCSVGCGFCAFDAGKLETVFDLSRPRNRELVADVAVGMMKTFGWPAAHGMLYWSTEPHDNPHYVRLLEFWQQLTGAALCTATARADEEWVGKLIGYYSKVPVQWPRISVLSRKIMYRLHRTFTPLQMRDTTLLMQQKDSEDLRAKVPGGRERMLKQLVDADDMRDVDFENLPEGFEPPQGSIACISGPLVNMVNRTIKLISPCYTTMEYRYGYRVLDETTFGRDGDFENALRRIVARSMVVKPYPEMPVRWRDDLKAVPHPDGFTLLSPTVRRDFYRGEIHSLTAELVGRGDLTYEQVYQAMSENERVGPISALAVIDSLFNKGFLCEMAITRDYRARREASDPSLRERMVPLAATA